MKHQRKWHLNRKQDHFHLSKGVFTASRPAVSANSSSVASNVDLSQPNDPDFGGSGRGRSLKVESYQSAKCIFVPMSDENWGTQMWFPINCEKSPLTWGKSSGECRSFGSDVEQCRIESAVRSKPKSLNKIVIGHYLKRTAVSKHTIQKHATFGSKCRMLWIVRTRSNSWTKKWFFWMELNVA